MVNVNFYENVKKPISDIRCELGSFLFSKNEIGICSLFFCYDGKTWSEIGSGYGFVVVENILLCTSPSKYKVVYSKSDKSLYVSNGEKFKKVVTYDDIQNLATKEYVDNATEITDIDKNTIDDWFRNWKEGLS